MEQSHPLFDISIHYFRIYESMPLPWRLRLPRWIYIPPIYWKSKRQRADQWPTNATFPMFEFGNNWETNVFYSYTPRKQTNQKVGCRFWMKYLTFWRIWKLSVSIGHRSTNFPSTCPYWQISSNVDDDYIVNPSHWHCMTINLPSDKEGVVSGWNF